MRQEVEIKRVVIYVRVSTAEQTKGVSLDVQKQTLLAEAYRQGWEVVEVCEDAGVSGKRYTSRPGIQRALELIERQEADCLLATKIDRVGRKARVIHEIVERVLDAGGVLKTAEFQFDRSPMGAMLLGVFAALAEMEYGAIRDRSMDARHELAKRGVQTAVRPPYGYHIVRRDDILMGLYDQPQLGQYVLVEPEASIIRKCFEDYAAGRTSLPKMARELNLAGVPTPKGGKAWRETSFVSIFNNPCYAGKPAFGRWETGSDEKRLSQKHPVTGRPLTSMDYVRPAPKENQIPLSAPELVSQETWDAVQAKMKANRQRRGGNPGRMRMLSGMTACPECGGTMFLLHNRPGYGPYFTCSRNRMHRRTHPGENVCATDYFEVASHEQAAATAIRAAVEHSDWIDFALAEYKKGRAEAHRPDELRKELAAVDRALVALQARQDATIKAQIDAVQAGVSASFYVGVLSEISAERKDLENRRGVLSTALREDKREEAAGDDEAVKLQVLHDVNSALSSRFLTGEEKRNLVGRVVEKVVCSKTAPGVQFTPGLFDSDTLHNIAE